MRTIAVIPARYASTRFPGKPLADIGGQAMIQRVYNQVNHAQSVSEVIVATDDERIEKEVRSFGGNVVMTSSDHVSGTDRCAEVMQNISGFDIVVNIQGDEPFVDPLQIDLLVSCFQNTETQIATLIKKITNQDELENPNRPKVIIDKNEFALYFSRQPLPYAKGLKKTEWLEKGTYFSHIGIYGFQTHVLQEITKLAPSFLENTEGLEQLRWLENGYKIKTALSHHDNDAVDTPEDLVLLKNKYNF